MPPRPDPSLSELRKQVTAAGGTLTRARVILGPGPSVDRAYERAFRRLGAAAPRFLSRHGDVVAWRVQGRIDLPGGSGGPADLCLDWDGHLVAVEWTTGGAFTAVVSEHDDAEKEREAFLLALRDAIRGSRAVDRPEATYVTNNVPVRVVHLSPAPGEPGHVLVLVRPPGTAKLDDELGDPDATREFTTTRGLTKLLLARLPSFVIVLSVLVLFVVLAIKKRLSFRIALPLTLLAFLSMLLGGFLGDSDVGGLLVQAITGVSRLAAVAFLLVFWSVGESLLRDTVPGFTTSLDALAAGRIGPRAGRALLSGLGAGAAIAGIRLLASAFAARNPSGSLLPVGPTFSLPFFGGTGSAFFEGPFHAALFVLLVAAFRFVTSRRGGDVLGAIAFALLFAREVPLSGYLPSLLVALLAAIPLLVVFQRVGFAALLFTLVSAPLFRDTLAAAHLASVGAAVPFLCGAASLAALAAVGVAALRRPEREEEGRVEGPEYLKKLESERRVKYEMDLLSRMQLALLPEKPPDVRGLDVGVKTVLATEAGGDLYDFIVDADGALWVAAGDVSGHGYSCGIQGAMVKAALVSLVGDGKTPARILADVDRVLKAARSVRLFTSLTLVKIDPATGKGVFANAGHPFPLLLEEGRCREMEAPGLPLGQGPARIYEDVPFELGAGHVLVFASDGLYEGPDRFDEPYGFDRPRKVLESIGLWRRPAESIVEALFADWRLHVGEGAPADDTTVLVVKRPTLV